MNRDQLLPKPPSYWVDYTKQNPYRDVGEDSWAPADLPQDRPLLHHRWTEMDHTNFYHNTGRDSRNDTLEHSSTHLQPQVPMENYHRQVRHIRPAISQGAIPSFMEYQERVPPPVQQPAPRCISQPGSYNNRMYDGPPQNEVPSPMRRRCSETAFASDDMDLALFVEATSGFSPYSPVNRTFEAAQQPWPNLRTSAPYQHPALAQIQQLSQPPQLSQSSPSLPLPIRHPRPQLPQYTQQQGPNVWQQRLEAEPHVWQSQEYEEDAPPPEEELPDYAQSQAEMQNRSRLEAKRRAEELQRRWRQRHSR